MDADAAPTSDAGPAPLLAVAGLEIGPRDDALPRLVGPLSFAVAPGEALGLVGESGSGKSLTALSLLGLLPANLQRRAGSITWQDGVDLAGLGERALRRYRGGEVAYIFQDPATALNPVLRVGRQVEEVLQVHRPELDCAARRRRLAGLFAEVELGGDPALLRRYPHQLSGGQRQRVLLAAALAGDPALLVADEATTALDVTIQRQVVALVQRLQAERGLAMLWISHDLALVRGLCPRLLVMQDGAVVEEGATEALFQDPQHPHTRELVAAATAAEEAGAVRAEAPALLEVEELHVAYPGPAKLLGRATMEDVIHGASFTLQAGRTLGIVGESGSGKSSLARAVLRLEDGARGRIRLTPPGAGAIDWSGLPEARLRPHRRHVGMVFQDPASALDPRQPLWRTVVEPIEIHAPAPREELRRTATGLLERVGLDASFLDRRPGGLSGGQAQRVGIARAIALDPCLIVCDEALSALDPTIQEQVLELLRTLQEESRVGYLFISHDLEVVGRIADEVMVLRDGRVVEMGPTAAVLGEPREAYTAELLAASRALHSGA